MLKIIIDQTMGQKHKSSDNHGLMAEKESKGRVVSLIEEAQEMLKRDSQQSTTDASMYLDMAMSALSNKPTKEE